MQEQSVQPPHPSVSGDPCHTTQAFDTAKLAQQLLQSAALERDGHAVQTLNHDSELRLVLVALRAGQRIAEHQTIQQATAQTLLGRLRLHVPGGDCEVPAGVVVVLRGAVVHEIEALETSVMLLSLVYRDAP